ncbi:MAG: tRNA 2-thiouridine synthesizing protein C [Motiliproteus sp.]|jgi:tRNA 2-thiouridine synthesizing protein C
MSQTATLLLVLRHSPYSSQIAREALDAALTAAAFEVPISLLFINDGVYQLLSEQHPEPLQIKNISKTLPALALYDIDRIYAARSCLETRGLGTASLVIETEILDDQAVALLFHQHKHMLSF